MCRKNDSNKESREQQPTIVIIGGGPAGLAMAAHLLNAGWTSSCVRVIERRSRESLLADTNSFYDMAASGIQALLRLANGAAAPRVFEEAVAYDKCAMYGGAKNTSTPFSTLEMTGRALGMPMFNITRAALLTALVEAVENLDPNCIEYETSATLLDHESGLVELESSSSGTKKKKKEEVQADLIVGADGIHSRLRKHIFGDTGLRSDGIVACYAVLPPLPEEERKRFPSPPGVNPNAFGLVGITADFCQYAVINSKATIWYTNFVLDDGKPYVGLPPPPTAGGWLEESKRRCQGGAPAMETLIDKTKEEDLQVVMCCDRLPLASYSRGRVVLVGDAAHPFTPYAGLGSSQAMVDAFCLAEALINSSGTTIDDAIKRYEHQRIQVANQLMEESRDLCNPTWSNRILFALFPWFFRIAKPFGLEESVADAFMATDGESLVNKLIPFTSKEQEEAYEALYEKSKAALRAQLSI